MGHCCNCVKDGKYGELQLGALIDPNKILRDMLKGVFQKDPKSIKISIFSD